MQADSELSPFIIVPFCRKDRVAVLIYNRMDCTYGDFPIGKRLWSYVERQASNLDRFDQEEIDRIV